MHNFEIENVLHIETDIEVGRKIVIDNDFCQAEIYLLGANLTHFQPKSEEKIIFDGKESTITPSKSAHFGIPICWPWFGPHPTDKSKPQHGFARNMLWDIAETKVLPTKETFIRLQLSENEYTLSLFPHHFQLTLDFIIGKTLTVALSTKNKSDTTMSISQALHSYFYVSHIQDIYIEGLENISYLDQLDNHTIKKSSNAIDIKTELDRIYIDNSETCRIIDPLLQRQIVIEKEHSNTTVIWNPGKENRLHDIGEDKYQQFVCVEVANTNKDTISLAPQETYTFKQTIYIKGST